MRRRQTTFSLVIASLLLIAQTESSHASDMTGAFVYIVGIGLLGCLLLGFVSALILKFAFKCGHWVWALIPATPIAALGILLLMRFWSDDYDRNYHAGPDLEYNGSHSVTVSADFTQRDLAKALARINQPSFKQDLANYTSESLSNYLFALDLTAPRGRTRRHYVTICVQPKVEVNTPVYEGIMFLFTKAVVAADPHPCETFLYTEPLKIR